MMFEIIASILVVFLGAVFGRVDGGGVVKFKVNEWLERFLCMFPFWAACYVFAGDYGALAMAGVLGIILGHGQYFLDRLLRGQKQGQEKLIDFFVTPLFGKDWRIDFDREYVFTAEQVALYNRDIKPKLYWRNVFGMFIGGFLVGLPAAILSFMYGEYLAGSLFLLTGFCKAGAYMIGYKFIRNYDTQSAEYINGGLRTLVCVTVFWSVVL